MRYTYACADKWENDRKEVERREYKRHYVHLGSSWSLRWAALSGGSLHFYRGIRVHWTGRCEPLKHVEKLSHFRGFREEGIHPCVQTQLFRRLLTVRAQGDNLKTDGTIMNIVRASRTTGLLGSRISYPRSTSSSRIRLAAWTPSHTGISERSSELCAVRIRVPQAYGGQTWPLGNTRDHPSPKLQ